jgi:hypothetical protein
LPESSLAPYGHSRTRHHGTHAISNPLVRLNVLAVQNDTSESRYQAWYVYTPGAAMNPLM